jgi:biopolymer transport protein TolR
MGMAVGGKKGTMADMNVVPLIDILLVLIIIFMVITPLTPKGLSALVPQPTPPDAKAQDEDLSRKTIVVQVLDNDVLKINEDAADWNTLGPRLNDIFKLRAEKVAFVKGDETVVFSSVAKAIDIMRASGVEKVGLITARLEAGQ